MTPLRKKKHTIYNDVNRYLVTSIADYVKVLKKIAKVEDGPLWFRGHSKASHKLRPGIFRPPYILHDKDGEPFMPEPGQIVKYNWGGHKGFNSERIFEHFKSHYSQLKNTIYTPQNDFEWLCLMQHYGIPTRLLDWSTNAFTALYFALYPYRPSKPKKTIKTAQHLPDSLTEDRFDGAVVFAIKPEKINGYTVFTKNQEPFTHVMDVSNLPPSDITSTAFPKHGDGSYFTLAACVSSKKFDFRILAQQGVFMLFEDTTWHLEYLYELKPFIHKIFIPRAVLGEMKSDLTMLGFTTETIYPDKDPNSVIAKNRLKGGVKTILGSEEAYVKSILKIK